MDYIAHIRNKDGKEQLLKDHLLDSMRIAENLGEKLCLTHLAGLAALLHDAGKFSDDFQHYLRAAVEDQNSAKRGSVDHSTAGGRLLYQKLHINGTNSLEKLVAEIVGNAIISHHSSQGLQDMLTLNLESDYLQRIEEKMLDNFDEVCACFFAEVMPEEKFMKYLRQAIKELETYVVKNKETVFTYNLFFLNKFIYSCLIDADRINTMLFEEAKELAPNINSKELFAGYYDKLLNHLAGFDQGKAGVSRINRLREEMSQQCDDFAEKDTGIYTLSIPTGGGKTLASLRFALKHAKDKGKERIIYVVPFTTIIEQNAKTVRDILLDDENILEHHSNVIEDCDKKDTDEQDSDSLENYAAEKTIRLTKDNWESPVIFTTMVQFLEVIYGSGTRRVRRFHNLTNAVIIFDEVQSVPLKCISMFNMALNYLEDCMNSTLVLCTATQPALTAVEKKLNVAPGSEMVTDVPEVIDAFKRTDIFAKIAPNGWSVEELTDFIKEKIDVKRSILTVLNTTSVVQKTFCLLQQKFGNEINLYHLSTMMCPAHRKVVLAEIRDKLKAGERVLCISTQLIEAGVDISFDCVIRSLAGCDSIAQAAGRCNRNGEKPIQEVYIVKLNSKVESLTRLKEIKRGQDVTMEILNSMALDPACFGGNLLTQEAMSVYFRKYFYESQTSLDYSVKKINKNLADLMNFESSLKSEYMNKHGKKPSLLLNDSFKTISKYFHVIDSQTTSVLVPYGKEGEELIADLNGELTSEELFVVLKKAQQYSVNLYDYQKQELAKEQLIYSPNNEYISILQPNAYSEVFGVDLSGETKMPLLTDF